MEGERNRFKQLATIFNAMGESEVAAFNGDGKLIRTDKGKVLEMEAFQALPLGEQTYVLDMVLNAQKNVIQTWVRAETENLMRQGKLAIPK